MQFQPGRLLKERYRILERLGAGGMGEVYLARDLQRRQPVAIKVMHRELETGTSELFRRRFSEEVDILRRISTPGVPAFVDNFDEDQRSYLIMEYIEGHSLETLLEASRDKDMGGLRPDLVVEVGCQVLRILKALHGQQPPLIHRDIKPSNIIIRTQDDTVFLVDFGLAREFHSKSSAKTLVGTAAYCPLEQFQGRPEPRSDLYSLGATMYELLTGCSPKPLNIPPIQEVMPNLPEDLIRIVNRSVRPRPHERYSDADDMLLLLEECAPRLNQIQQAQPTDTTEPIDRIEELIRRWGKGMIPAPDLPPLPPLPNVVDSKRLLPLMRRAQARSRELHGSRWDEIPTRFVILLLLLTVGLGFLWMRARTGRQQLALAREAYPNGPGPHWDASVAAGAFPADGIGLGEVNSFSSAAFAGVVFERDSVGPLKSMACQVQRLKGWPRVLMYADPVGVLLEPENGNYNLRVVNADGNVLRGIDLKTRANSGKLALGNSPRIDLKLVAGKGKLMLYTGKSSLPISTSEDWQPTHAGVVLLNPDKGARVVVRNLTLQ